MVTTSPLRRIVTLSTLVVVALGAIALAGFWHPNALAEDMQMYLPKITLPTVIVAAAVDGINPCAFTVLLLLITVMLATMQVSPRRPGDAGEQSLRAIRTRILSMGGIYIAAVFLTYLGLGVDSSRVLFFSRVSTFPPGLAPWPRSCLACGWSRTSSSQTWAGVSRLPPKLA